MDVHLTIFKTVCFYKLSQFLLLLFFGKRHPQKYNKIKKKKKKMKQNKKARSLNVLCPTRERHPFVDQKHDFFKLIKCPNMRNVTFENGTNSEAVYAACTDSTFQTVYFRNMTQTKRVAGSYLLQITQTFSMESGSNELLLSDIHMTNILFPIGILSGFGNSITTIRLLSSTFVNAVGAISWIAAYSMEVSDVTMTQTSWNGNWISPNSSVLSFQDAFQFNIIRSTFLNNHWQSRMGGVVYANNIYNMSIVDCTFTNNSAVDGGGVILTVSTTLLDINKCTFVDNGCNGDGGAIYLAEDPDHIWNVHSVVTISKSTFQNNFAYHSGGAVRMNQGKLILTDSSFYGNIAQTGGALTLTDLNKLIITGCKFVNNTAFTYGGVLADIHDGGIREPG
ncbi:outer membrane autotransporter barrel domain-containing protein, partial [Reticulomyxa filosa]